MMAKRRFSVLLFKASLLIGTAAAVSLAFWSQLQVREHVYIRELTKVLGRTEQKHLSDEMSSRMLAQERLAKLIKHGVPRRNWEDQAKLLMEHNPGFIAEQWMDPTYQVRWVATEAAGERASEHVLATDAPLRGLLEGLAFSREKHAILTRGFPLSDRKVGRRVVVPIYKGENFLGFLIAVLDEEKNFQSILADQAALMYSIVVLEDNQEIYRMPGICRENEKEWGQEVALQLPGAKWRVRVWPKSEVFREIGSTLLEMGLAVGSVIGLIIFILVDFARTAYSKSRELSQTRAELELEVQERTAELQSSNKQLEDEIHERKQAEESLRELSGRLLRLRDEEQRRIARELHDSTAQILGALAINLERVQQFVLSGEISKSQKLLAQSTNLAEQAITEIRTLSYLLHPPLLDDLGLEGAVPWYAAGFCSRCGIRVKVAVQPDLGRFPREVELGLFRVMQEALTNIHLHSGSPTADITLFKDASRVALQVEDHGGGIPAGLFKQEGNAREAVGVGIAGMRERLRQLGGRLEIASGDNGTCIKATLPIDVAKAVSEHDNPRQDTEVRQASSGNPITANE
jgi:signal transduction histidine kinase